MKEETVHQIKTMGKKYIATGIDVLLAKNKKRKYIHSTYVSKPSKNFEKKLFYLLKIILMISNG